MKSQRRSKRKFTGGKYKIDRKKKSRELAGISYTTEIGEKRLKFKRILAGKKKIVLLSAQKINVLNPKTKKNESMKVLSVEKNTANKAFERSNKITKGAIVKTDKGLVKITSRPTQDGCLNGILIQE